MSKKNTLFLMFATSAVLMAAILFTFFLIVSNEGEIAAAENRRLESYKLADELRQTSDDLTRMARTYVVSTDPRYLAYFKRIVDIRDGAAPRPVDYDTIYWDFVIATGQKPRPDEEPAALEALMREMNFTADEFALLRQAQNRSDGLIELEERAMNAVQGRYPDEKGDFVIEDKPDFLLARELVHGDAYHDNKAEIMEPINEFFGKVNTRTTAEVAALRTQGNRLTVLAVGLMLAAVMIMMLSYLVIQHRIIGPAGEPLAEGEELAARERTNEDGAASFWNAWPLLAVALMAIIGIVAFTWWNQSVLTQRTRQELSNSLTTVMNTTSKAALDWMGDREDEARMWANLPAVRQVCRDLREAEPSQEALLDVLSQSGLIAELDPLSAASAMKAFCSPRQTARF